MQKTQLIRGKYANDHAAGRRGDQQPSPLRLSTAKVDRGSSRQSSSRCAERREDPGAGGMAKGFSREERDGIRSMTIQNRPPGIAQWSIAAFRRRFRKRYGERARLRKTNARGATSEAVQRKIKCSPIRPGAGGRDGGPRCPTAAFNPGQHPSMPGGNLRPPAAALDARRKPSISDGGPRCRQQGAKRRNDAPSPGTGGAPAYPSYFLAASRRCSMMGMPWGQVTSQDPHWMQSDALPGSACHW